MPENTTPAPPLGPAGTRWKDPVTGAVVHYLAPIAIRSLSPGAQAFTSWSERKPMFGFQEIIDSINESVRTAGKVIVAPPNDPATLSHERAHAAVPQYMFSPEQSWTGKQVRDTAMALWNRGGLAKGSRYSEVLAQLAEGSEYLPGMTYGENEKAIPDRASEYLTSMVRTMKKHNIDPEPVLKVANPEIAGKVREKLKFYEPLEKQIQEAPMPWWSGLVTGWKE